MASSRPDWCPYVFDCDFQAQAGNQICVGQLLRLDKHKDEFNTHRLCLKDTEKSNYCVRINAADAYGIVAVLKTAFKAVWNNPAKVR